MHYIGKINRDIYKCITEDITTEDVIITDERIQHIKEHHPGHFKIVAPFLQNALEEPDYILEDSNKSGLLLKKIEENGLQIQVVLRIQTSADTDGFKNSVISAWKIRDKEYNRLIRNKNILYKRRMKVLK